MYNIKFHLILSLIAFFFIGGVAQESYTKYETGSDQDVVTQPQGGVCMMGGSTESDDAMRWFLERADGGDVLVIRASGSDGYNEYLHSELGVSINSVTTIVFQEAVAAEETYVQDKIKQAEAIWIAGGDQWKYVQYWRHTSVASLINEALASRNIVVGGTSAGMAILGGFYFTAQNGTIRSEDALNNPYDDRITLDSTSFIANNYLKNVLTDTHYDDPDRSGRHTAFLARVLVDYGVVARGIACEEYTAVCIDENGIARVFGGYPTYDDFAYFIQPNCQMNSPLPESCRPDEQLTWNLEETALQVYKIAGTKAGNNSFDLKDWATASGGVWEYWWAEQGELNKRSVTSIDCTISSSQTVLPARNWNIYPNPTKDVLNLNIDTSTPLKSIRIMDVLGKTRYYQTNIHQDLQIDLSTWAAAYYILEVHTESGQHFEYFVVE